MREMIGEADCSLRLRIDVFDRQDVVASTGRTSRSVVSQTCRERSWLYRGQC